jgi:hypothetical protein
MPSLPTRFPVSSVTIAVSVVVEMPSAGNELTDATRLVTLPVLALPVVSSGGVKSTVISGPPA